MTKNRCDFDISFQESKTILVDTFKNFFVLLVLFTIPPVALRLDLVFQLDGFISEVSITENLQLLLLGITVFLFLKIAYKFEDLRRASVLIAGFFLTLFIRENDALFDMVYHGFWFPIALTVALLAITYFMLDYKKGFVQLATYLKMPQMRLIILSIGFLLVFTRLFGMGSFWKMVMVEHYIYDVKSMIEEGTELLAYIFILFGSYKMYSCIISCSKEKTQK